MYITVNDIKGERRINLSYLIHANKETLEGTCFVEITVITMLSNNIQYEVVKPHTINISGNKKLILSRTYAGREFLSVLEGMTELRRFENDERVIKKNNLREITEMIFNLNELDNTDNLEDGRPSNALFTYHVTADEDFTCFKPNIPQYKQLKNGEFVSLSLRIMDQKNNIITDGLQVTVVLYIHDCKS